MENDKEKLAKKEKKAKKEEEKKAKKSSKKEKASSTSSGILATPLTSSEIEQRSKDQKKAIKHNLEEEMKRREVEELNAKEREELGAGSTPALSSSVCIRDFSDTVTSRPIKILEIISNNPDDEIIKSVNMGNLDSYLCGAGYFGRLELISKIIDYAASIQIDVLDHNHYFNKIKEGIHASNNVKAFDWIEEKYCQRNKLTARGSDVKRFYNSPNCLLQCTLYGSFDIAQIYINRGEKYPFNYRVLLMGALREYHKAVKEGSFVLPNASLDSFRESEVIDFVSKNSNLDTTLYIAYLKLEIEYYFEFGGDVSMISRSLKDCRDNKLIDGDNVFWSAFFNNVRKLFSTKKIKFIQDVDVLLDFKTYKEGTCRIVRVLKFFKDNGVSIPTNSLNHLLYTILRDDKPEYVSVNIYVCFEELVDYLITNGAALEARFLDLALSLGIWDLVDYLLDKKCPVSPGCFHKVVEFGSNMNRDREVLEYVKQRLFDVLKKHKVPTNQLPHSSH